MSAPMLLSIKEVALADPAVLETRRRLAQRARRLAWYGLGWHVVEAAVAIGAGLVAGSVALVGFGGDSLIEVSAGLVVLWRFAERRLLRASAERRSQRLISLSFYLLAIYIAVEVVSSLAGGSHPAVSWVGIGLAAATLVTMPPLAIAKSRVAQSLGSSSATSESRQSMLCAYLSAGLLVGLGLNALAGWWWADPATALMISAVAVREGRDAWRGESCCIAAPVLADGASCHQECCADTSSA